MLTARQRHSCVASRKRVKSDSACKFKPTYQCLTDSPSIYKGSTTSWLMSSKFSWPIQCSTFLFLPVKKLSTTVTSWPSIISLSVRWDPTKPAPPVIYWRKVQLFSCCICKRHKTTKSTCIILTITISILRHRLQSDLISSIYCLFICASVLLCSKSCFET